MRFVFAIVVWALLPFAAVAAEDRHSETPIRNILTKQKTWIMYWELTDALLPSERAHKLTYEFFERGPNLKGRLVFDYGGCDFDVSLRGDEIGLRYCMLDGSPSLTFDPSDAKYPFKGRNNPRKLWLAPKN